MKYLGRVTKLVICFICITGYTLKSNCCCDDTETTKSMYHAYNFDILAQEIIEQSELEVTKKTDHKKNRKPWTFIVYMAADNDLRPFAIRNIKQMSKIGSNKNLNILAQLHIRLDGKQKIVRRYYIEEEKILQINHNEHDAQILDSGDPKAVISCFEWATKNYPADKYAFILWNHGTGIIDPAISKIINPSELFALNPITHKLDLNRSIPFLEFVADQDIRGICWDDSSGNYLTNQKLSQALREISTRLLGGKKIDLLGFDACLMSMLEVADLIKPYTNIMVGSQEVELGTGWPYNTILALLHKTSASPKELGGHIVEMYQVAYQNVTNDYTQSAIELYYLEKLEENVHQVAIILSCLLKANRDGAVKRIIEQCRNKKNCTHFDEPSYVDLGHFYSNLQKQVDALAPYADKETATTKDVLNTLLEDGARLIKLVAFATKSGKNLRNAHGLSIYFPERAIHSSYRKTPLANSNEWVNFLTRYVGTTLQP